MNVSFKKGQGATEYIVVLAIVLMVALVVVGLLGFFPGFSSDTQSSESSSYWQSARPLAIVDALQTNTSGANSITLVIENHAPTAITVTLLNLTAVPSGVGGWNASSTIISAGERVTIAIANVTANALADCTGRSGKTNSYNVTFVYNQDPLTGKKQLGSKPLSAICG